MTGAGSRNANAAATPSTAPATFSLLVMKFKPADPRDAYGADEVEDTPASSGAETASGVSAAQMCIRDRQVQDRIERVYTHDGPGFKAGAFSPDDWRKLDGRIHRTVPQDSVIGMLMESHTPPRCV